MNTVYRLSFVCLFFSTSFIFSTQNVNAQNLQLQTIVTGLALPVGIVQDPTNPQVQFIVQQRGRIRVVVDGVLQANDFLNLTGIVSSSGSERGLLGLAFSPDYATTRRFYVNFTNSAGNTVVSRFKRSENDPLVADLNSRFDLRWGGPTGTRWIVQPFSNHNGGHLAFGPDGCLYIGLGDGGDAGDPGHRAQNPNLYLGKMLRIDVNVPDDDPEGYVVPADNPFLDGDPVVALPEIWAFGLRNPWKYSFDKPEWLGTGALIIGDVGQNAWEEIDYEHAGDGGRNYGWRNREGFVNFNNTLPPAYTPLIDPIHVYARGSGGSITGGWIYRGTMLPCEYFGRYFYADYIQRRLWSLKINIDPNTGQVTVSDIREHTNELGGNAALGNVSMIGTDANGELFIVSYASSTGRILRLMPKDHVWITEILEQRGAIVEGGLRELLCPDNYIMRYRSTAGFLVNQPNIKEWINVMQTDMTNATSLDFKFVWRSDRNGAVAQVALKNWSTGQFVQIGQTTLGTVNQTDTFNGVPAANFIRGDGRIEMRVFVFVTQQLFVPAFFTIVDQIQVTPH